MTLLSLSTDESETDEEKKDSDKGKSDKFLQEEQKAHGVYRGSQYTEDT